MSDKVRGWRRLIVIVLLAWWAWCGFLVVTNVMKINDLDPSSDFTLGSAREAVSDNRSEPDYRRDAGVYLNSIGNIQTGLLGATFGPLLAWALLAIVGRFFAGYGHRLDVDDA